MTTVPRHYYNPTPTQRAELRLAAFMLRERVRQSRERRMLEEARREYEAEARRLGWSDSAAAEFGEIKFAGAAQ